MKSYTDIDQSKKLSEILSTKGADMEYMFLKRDGSMVSSVPFIKDGYEEPDCSYNMVPCWSIAALLNVLPKIVNNETLYIETSAALWHIGYRNVYIARGVDLIDICYELILKLHELKLL